MSLHRAIRPVLRASGASRAMAQVAYDQALANTPETKITTLANGFRVVTEQTPHQTAAVSVHVDAGSRFENAENNGTAHFLEHMAFKGTKTRSQSQIEQMVENKGMRLDAYTSRESTVYTARCFRQDANDAVNLLGDILMNAKMDSTAVENERGVILREMQEVNSIPEEVVMDYLHTTAFQGSSLGYTILGPEENIKSITNNDLHKYMETFYTAPRMVLVGTGGVDHDQLVKTAETVFGGLSGENKAPKVGLPDFHGSELRYRDDSTPVASIAIAVEGASWSSPEFFPLMVANSIIGSWDRSFGGSKNLSSGLARITADEKLAHSFLSFNTSYSDTGLWGIYATCDREKVEDFCFEATQEWLRIAHSATDAEVERAKAQLRSGLLFSVDSTSMLDMKQLIISGLQAVGDEIGRQILTLGRRMPAIEIDARINAVTAADVRGALNSYVYDRCPAVAGIGDRQAFLVKQLIRTGPIEGLPDYNRLRSNMVWLRT